MIIFKAKNYTDEIDLIIRNKVEKLYTDKVLAIVSIGRHKSSTKFIEIKKKLAESFNIDTELFDLKRNAKKKEVFAVLDKINLNDKYGGVIVQHPFPSKYDYKEIATRINPEKDIDFFNPKTYGEFVLGIKDDFMPPTVRAFDYISNSFKLDLKGKVFLVVGQGLIVGRPIANYLQSKEVTLITANIHTTNLEELLKIADVVVTGASSPNLIKGEQLKRGATVIDFSYKEIDKKIIGDFDMNSNINHLSLVCAVPGGIGPLTIRYLLLNFLDFVEYREQSL
ncbi:bifunctional 5,10-methylenetetrahydrofolate dehydrogenase/5,10-methenyltetrahydrofolate cyclohydrolase [Patescibacteria group bacterium]|nr:bifunctional 5,10-methylenetetrahydrofolate dehydrogenase/5,10-methenyltetrahydrofolate cyclohydrolase [Patescibacteria group bacterium]